MAQKVAGGVYKGVTTSELDELAAETAASLTSTHPDYATVSSGYLGPRICLLGRACDWVQRPFASLRSLDRLFVGSANADRRSPGLHAQLAARIAVSNLHKNTLKSFSQT